MRTLVDQAGSRSAASRGFRGHSDQCHLLDSGESLRALRIARYLTAGMSANESLESLGALAQGEQALQEGNCPHLGYGIKTFHVIDRGAEEYSVS